MLFKQRDLKYNLIICAFSRLFLRNYKNGRRLLALQYNVVMHFYEVWVRSNHYHGKVGLTYCYDKELLPGQLVVVPMRQEDVVGVVLTKINKPHIKTKPINRTLDLSPLPESTIKLMYWLKEFYPSSIGVIVQQFLPQGLTGIFPDVVTKQSPPIINQLPRMTAEQLFAYHAMQLPDTYLLHGRTGSGKTRLYLEMAKDSIQNNRSVILLTPEISLTAQLEISFRQVFKDRVFVLHSTLTPKQRAERWVGLLEAKDPMVVIGPRSAVFSPLKDIGLIVVDEEHEPAYKQEQAPYYLTTRVAAQLRQIHRAHLILGSATPLVSDYYVAKTLAKPILRLQTLARPQRTDLKVKIIDFKNRELFNRSEYLSMPLIEAVEKALASHYQIMLYLNRRGTARVIVCEVCDWQAHCPRCDLPLIYHGDSHSLRCHVCGYSTGALVSCPKCHNPSIKYLSIGTKAVVEEAAKLFPNARIKRFDADNLKADRLEANYASIKDGDVDIIVGTQMLAKGLDLPKLSVLGVIMADTSLQLPDYTANERTFQLLEQVIGRVGRGHVTGQALIQTYQPDNKTIAAAIVDDWNSFYDEEIRERHQYGFPPFTHLLKLSVQRASAAAAQKAATKLMRNIPSDLHVDGPAPAFHERQSGKYRWQLIIKSAERSRLISCISSLPSGWSYNIDPIDLM